MTTISAPCPIRQAKLQDTHPNLYRSLLTVAIVDVVLGLNFLVFTPTFEQFNIPKNVIGVSWLTVGSAMLVFLVVYRNLKWVRITGWAGVGFALFWGIGTTQTLFEGTSSAQLFILYTGLRAGLVIPLLLEPYFNPITANGNRE